jgi:hypothetical protein
MAAAIGVVHPPPPKQSGSPFHRPTDIAVHPVTGDLFVSDGYGNSRIHRFDSEGKHIQSWGEAGTDDGKFNIPHCISLLKAGEDEWHVLVADRENQRVQVFSTEGKYLYQVHAHRAVAVEAIHHQPVVAGGDGQGIASTIFIAEQGSTSTVQRGDGMNDLTKWTKNIGHRVGMYKYQEFTKTVVGSTGGASAESTKQSELVRTNTIGAPLPGERPDQFNWLHSIAIDSKGNVYAAEVSFCECGKYQHPFPREMVSLRRWNRLA